MPRPWAWASVLACTLGNHVSSRPVRSLSISVPVQGMLRLRICRLVKSKCVKRDVKGSKQTLRVFCRFQLSVASTVVVVVVVASASILFLLVGACGFSFLPLAAVLISHELSRVSSCLFYCILFKGF